MNRTLCHGLFVLCGVAGMAHAVTPISQSKPVNADARIDVSNVKGSVNVTAAINYPDVSLEVSDDGIGFPEKRVFGRGLTGMQERVRALSGTLELSREGGWTFVRCQLAAEEAAANMSAPEEA